VRFHHFPRGISREVQDTIHERAAARAMIITVPKVARGLIGARMASLSAYSVVQLLYISILILYVLNLS